MGWLSGEQALRVLFALPVGVLLARYLGAERFGLLCYAQALVTMFIPLAASGMSGIVVRDLVREGCSKEETLGSAFMIQFVGATLAALLSIIAVLILRPGETLVQLIVVIVSARNLFAAFNVIDYWYQHKVDPGQVATGRLLAAFLIAGVKLLLIWLKASLLYFAAVLVAEVALIAGFFYYIYVNDADRLDPWRVSIDRVKSLLYESWPLTLTGFAILVQAYIDQVMLGNMLGDEVVGQYSVAIRLIGYLAFLPVALHKSWAPSVTAAKEKGQEAYDRRMSQLYQLMFACVWGRICGSWDTTFAAGDSFTVYKLWSRERRLYRQRITVSPFHDHCNCRFGLQCCGQLSADSTLRCYWGNHCDDWFIRGHSFYT